MRIRIFLALFFILFSFVCCKQKNKHNEDIVVFCASSLTPVLNEIKKDWEESTDVRIIINSASSGTLARQLENGAQADIFLSANQEWMDYLISTGYYHEKAKQIAKNKLVVISHREAGFNTENLDDALRNIINSKSKIAIGDPGHVPLGKYTWQFIENNNIKDDISDKLIKTKDARSALRLVALGEASYGITYYSDAVSSPSIEILSPVPSNLHEPILYYGLLLDTAHLKSAEFLRHLISNEAKASWLKYGFDAINGL